MKYLLLIYQNAAAWAGLPAEERTAMMEEAGALWDELTESGEAVSGEGLADVARTKTVRVRGGVPAVTDGPYLEAKEQLAGFTMLDCATEERAIEIATRWPDTRHWALEVRPLVQ